MGVLKTSTILIWAGTNATIPAGWERETALDGVFPKGTADATNPNTAGGTSTHQHSATESHNHTMGAHTHNITINATNSLGASTAKSGSACPPAGHAHSAYASGAVASASISSVAATYASCSNNPPYFKVIFVKPQSMTNVVPNNMIGLWDSDTPPTGFSFCDGANSTPDLRNKYLLGAGTGADAGDTGGSLTNVHSLTHTHAVSHEHSASTSGNASVGDKNNNSTGSFVATAHTHSITLSAVNTAPATNPNLTTTETVEPAYTTLSAIRNTNGISRSIPRGMVALYLGELGAIPAGWKLCDGNSGTVDMRGKHLKISATVAGYGISGGSNTHTHASQNHSHTVSHTHAGTGTLTHASTYGRDSSANNGSIEHNSATHTSITVATVDYSLVNAATTADSQSNEPEYRTVAFIKLDKVEAVGAFMLNMI